MIRIIFSIIALLIVVAGIAIGSLYFFINPNELKPTIIAEVKQRTGCEMAIHDDLTWSFYPRFSIHLKNVELNNKDLSPFLNLTDVIINAHISDLFAKRHHHYKIYIAQANVSNLKLNNLNLDVKWENNRLNLNSIRADLYAGSLNGRIEMETVEKIPTWHTNFTLNNIQLKPLLMDLQGDNNKLKLAGLGQIKLQLTSAGNTDDQLVRNLVGITEFKINDGYVEGIDLNYLLQSADALINKQPIGLPSALNQTAFNSFSGLFQIQNGYAATTNLLLVTPAFVTNGTGNIMLFSQVINFKLHLTAQQNLKKQWDIPVLLSGNLSKPTVQLDSNEWQKLQAQQALNELKIKARNEVQKHVHGKVGELLQDLLSK